MFIFRIMSTFLFQWCVIFWANQRNTSDWVKYGNIWIFSGTYFGVYVLGFFPYIGNCGSEETFIFVYVIQCSTESIGKLSSNVLFFSKLLHWYIAVHFFLQLQVTGSNTESTENLPPSTGFKLFPGANIRFEKIKLT